MLLKKERVAPDTRADIKNPAGRTLQSELLKRVKGRASEKRRNGNQIGITVVAVNGATSLHVAVPVVEHGLRMRAERRCH